MLNEFIERLYTNHFSLEYSEELYNNLLKDIEHFYISPQIYTLLNKAQKMESTPLSFQLSLKERYKSLLIQNMLIKNLTDVIFTLFEEMKIHVIPLKGVYFSQKYFGDFNCRPTSDIDLLIKYDQVESAVDCIKDLGYTIEEKTDENHFHRSFSKIIPGTSERITVEIHWDIIKENTSKVQIKELWDSATSLNDYIYIKELSNFHTFYFIILHAWRHNLDSMKHFLDIIQIIHVDQKEINYELLFITARKHKTLKRVHRTLSIVYQQFPHLHLVLELPIKKNYGRHWQYEVIREDKVNRGKLYLDFIDYQFLSYESFFHKLIALLEWLFPSSYGLEAELKNNKATYFQLFKQRSISFFHSVTPKNRKG
ncbi:nucleotidyltransferase family protein [Metabacillus halosaccharovorans]|uniref:nucleotidyltransferase family protein n=1 Tax=Metabacillus halosaccharovorans TaxID=930124 RepID=UPI00403D6D48